MSIVVQSPTDPKTLRKVIVASSVGTVIEWYDFYIFGMLAAQIGANFFPSGDSTTELLKSLAVFWVGFVVRPFGALVFGRLGDIVGRKATFMITLLMMGASTFLVGVLPSYAQVGALAPILLIVLRIGQGLALGGEYGGAATYVAESAPANRRGYFTSFIQITATAGLILSLLVITTARTGLSKADFEGWGWRIPFLLSIFLVLFSYFIRKKMAESPLFAKLKSRGQISKNPLRESFVEPVNRRLVLIALFGATMGQGVVWYTSQFYAKTFMEKALSIDPTVVSTVMIVALVLASPLFVVFGALSDKIGRKKIMLAGMILAAVSYVPLYMAMSSVAGTVEKGGTITSIPMLPMIALVLVQVVFVTMVYGPIAAFLVEMFPVRIRYTSMSLPYHIGNGVFGGLVPLLSTYLVAHFGNNYAGLAYPIAIASICFVIGLFVLPSGVQDTRMDEIDGEAS
ncbi:MAG: MHS family MFS transporter [Armatimonadetes bacterium]|nr:MHS family MFS transporter [Armatimonadota bacterium]